MTIEARIRQDIEARIRSGDWRPGYRIPFEHELVAVYRCSRATVGKALGSLAKAGLIERRRKAGSFVAHPQVHSAVLAVPDLAELITTRGERYRWVLLARQVEPSAPEIPSPVLHVEGLHLADDEPFALERRWISLDAVPGAADAPFESEAPGTWLLHHIPWTTAQHRIRAVNAEKREADCLNMPRRTACLELWRTTWRAGTVVTTVRQLFCGDRFDLVADFAP